MIMSYKWGKTSKERLSQCDAKLQALCNRMLERSKCDLTILCGFRDMEEQESAFSKGTSKAHFGQSKHNFYPSRAVDIAPYPIDWNKDNPNWTYMVALAYDTARELGIKIKCGMFFNSISDFPHIQIDE